MLKLVTIVPDSICVYMHAAQEERWKRVGVVPCSADTFPACECKWTHIMIRVRLDVDNEKVGEKVHQEKVCEDSSLSGSTRGWGGEHGLSTTKPKRS